MEHRCGCEREEPACYDVSLTPRGGGVGYEHLDRGKIAIVLET